MSDHAESCNRTEAECRVSCTCTPAPRVSEGAPPKNFCGDPECVIDCEQCREAASFSEASAPREDSIGSATESPINRFSGWSSDLLSKRLREIAWQGNSFDVNQALRAAADRLDALSDFEPAPSAPQTVPLPLSDVVPDEGWYRLSPALLHAITEPRERDLSVRACNALAGAGLRSVRAVRDFLANEPEGLLRVKNCGPRIATFIEKRVNEPPPPDAHDPAGCGCESDADWCPFNPNAAELRSRPEDYEFRAKYYHLRPSPSPASAGKVWVVESGDYEQRFVWGVYRSPDAAVASIKATYGPPYIVRWNDVEDCTEDRYCLSGDFEGVVGYSTKHVGCWDIWPAEVR